MIGGASIVTHSFRIEVDNGSSGDDFDGEARKRAETSSILVRSTTFLFLANFHNVPLTFFANFHNLPFSIFKN